MQLPGRLRASTLGDLLGPLHRARTTGILELAELSRSVGCSVPGRRHRIHLTHGLVTGVDTAGAVPPLGELLQRRGFIRPIDLFTLVSRLSSGDPRPAGEILVAQGAVTSEVVQAALLAQLRDKIEVLFSLEDATISFHPARFDAARGRRLPPLSPNEFLHGRARARDRGPRREGRADWSQAASRAAPPPPPPAQRIDPERARALQVLGLSASADAGEIRRAFKRLASELHPDRHVAAPRVEREHKARLFAGITAAYHSLV